MQFCIKMSQMLCFSNAILRGGGKKRNATYLQKQYLFSYLRGHFDNLLKNFPGKKKIRLGRGRRVGVARGDCELRVSMLIKLSK